MKKAAEWIAPDWLDAEAWADFEAHRQEIKQPLTDRARALAANKLRGLSKQAQRETINRTIEGGWTGLFPTSPPEKIEVEYVKPDKLSQEDWRRRQKVALEKLRELRRKL